MRKNPRRRPDFLRTICVLTIIICAALVGIAIYTKHVYLGGIAAAGILLFAGLLAGDPRRRR